MPLRLSLSLAALLGCLALALPNTAPAGSPYQRYLASSSVCAGADNANLSPDKQERTMRCLINYARSKQGLRKTEANRQLRRSADLKAAKIIRCNQFSHEPCGTAFTSTFRAAGYTQGSWSVGENIAWWAPQDLATPRKIMLAWLESPAHRRNIFTAKWRQQGVSLVRAPRFQGSRRAAVWVSQFGTRS